MRNLNDITTGVNLIIGLSKQSTRDLIQAPTGAPLPEPTYVQNQDQKYSLDELEARDDEGNSLFLKAAENGNLDLMVSLFGHYEVFISAMIVCTPQAKVKFLMQTNNEGDNYLHILVKNENYNELSKILNTLKNSKNKNLFWQLLSVGLIKNKDNKTWVDLLLEQPDLALSKKIISSAIVKLADNENAQAIRDLYESLKKYLWANEVFLTNSHALALCGLNDILMILLKDPTLEQKIPAELSRPAFLTSKTLFMLLAAGQNRDTPAKTVMTQELADLLIEKTPLTKVDSLGKTILIHLMREKQLSVIDKLIIMQKLLMKAPELKTMNFKVNGKEYEPSSCLNDLKPKEPFSELFEKPDQDIDALLKKHHLVMSHPLPPNPLRTSGNPEPWPAPRLMPMPMPIAPLLNFQQSSEYQVQKLKLELEQYQEQMPGVESKIAQCRKDLEKYEARKGSLEFQMIRIQKAISEHQAMMVDEHITEMEERIKNLEQNRFPMPIKQEPVTPTAHLLTSYYAQTLPPAKRQKRDNDQNNNNNADWNPGSGPA